MYLELIAEKFATDQVQFLVGAGIVGESVDKTNGQYLFKKPTRNRVFYDGRTFVQSSAFWTRRLWDLAGPVSEDLHYALDYDLWLRMLLHVDEVAFVDKPLSFARSHSGQKTRPDNYDKIYREREFSAMRAARARGEPSLVWFLKVWARRLRSAVRSRKRSIPSLLPTKYHWEALRSFRASTYEQRG